MAEYEMHNRDCLEVIDGMADEAVDIIITDPPYGMAFVSGRAATPRHNMLRGDETLDVCSKVISASHRVCKEGGAIAVFCDWKHAEEVRVVINDAGYEIVSQVIWNRMHHGMGDLKGGFAPMHDVIWYASKGRRQFHGRRPQSVISEQRPGPDDDHGHPTCKPVGLMRYLVEHLAAPGEVVFDPFTGSGSTGVACGRLDRRFIGAEIDESFYNTASQRIAAAYAQQTLF